MSRGLFILMCAAALFYCGHGQFRPPAKLNKLVPPSIIEDDALPSFFMKFAHSLKFIEKTKAARDNHVERKQQPENPPDFCHGLVCPVFKPLKGGKTYEFREYDATQWYSTNLEGYKLDKAEELMFMKLFDYIDKHNSKDLEIPMTAPVLVKLIPGEGPTCKNNFTMSFFNDPANPKPPKPDDKAVFFSKLPKQKVYVISFKGYADEKSWISHALQLADALNKDGKSFFSDYYFTAGYDSPFRVLDRHNEVWYVAKEE